MSDNQTTKKPGRNIDKELAKILITGLVLSYEAPARKASTETPVESYEKCFWIRTEPPDMLSPEYFACGVTVADCIKSYYARRKG